MARTDLTEVSSRSYPSLERAPGKKDNWVEKAGGLPSYIERIAKHLHYEKGRTIGAAIATAVNTVKKWCATGKNHNGGTLKATTKAKACAAVASWEKKKAKSKLKEAAEQDAEALSVEILEEISALATRRLQLVESYTSTLDEAKTTGRAATVRAAGDLLEARLDERVPLAMIGGPAAEPREMRRAVLALREEADELRALIEATGGEAPEAKGDKADEAMKRVEKAKQAPAVPPIKKGDTGGNVENAQQRLGQLGYDVKADGSFGELTEDAVKTFQRDHKLTEDGEVGPQTRMALRGTTPEDVQERRSTPPETEDEAEPGADEDGPESEEDAPSVSPNGDTATATDTRDWLTKGVGVGSEEGDPRVSAAQSALQAMGTFVGDEGVDGRFGPETERGVKRVQRRYGLKADGIVGDQTWNLLNRHAKDTLEEAGFTINTAYGTTRLKPKGQRRKPENKGGGGGQNKGNPGQARAPKGSPTGGQFVSKGTTGASVRGAQEALGIESTGNFDKSMEQAVRRYQRQNGLQVDGVIGAQTVASLRGRGATAPGELGGGDRRWLENQAPKGKKRLQEATSKADTDGKGVAGGDMKRCPSCNWRNKGGTTKCKKCGAALRKKGDGKLEEASSRGAARKAVGQLFDALQIKRLPDGTFAPKGRGRILRPGDNVSIGRTRGKVTPDGRSVQLGNGENLKLASPALQQAPTPIAAAAIARGRGKRDRADARKARVPSTGKAPRAEERRYDDELEKLRSESYMASPGEGETVMQRARRELADAEEQYGYGSLPHRTVAANYGWVLPEKPTKEPRREGKMSSPAEWDAMSDDEKSWYGTPAAAELAYSDFSREQEALAKEELARLGLDGRDYEDEDAAFAEMRGESYMMSPGERAEVENFRAQLRNELDGMREGDSAEMGLLTASKTADGITLTDEEGVIEAEGFDAPAAEQFLFDYHGVPGGMASPGDSVTGDEGLGFGSHPLTSGTTGLGMPLVPGDDGKLKPITDIKELVGMRSPGFYEAARNHPAGPDGVQFDQFMADPVGVAGSEGEVADYISDLAGDIADSAIEADLRDDGMDWHEDALAKLEAKLDEHLGNPEGTSKGMFTGELDPNGERYDEAVMQREENRIYGMGMASPAERLQAKRVSGRRRNRLRQMAQLDRDGSLAIGNGSITRKSGNTYTIEHESGTGDIKATNPQAIGFLEALDTAPAEVRDELQSAWATLAGGDGKKRDRKRASKTLSELGGLRTGGGMASPGESYMPNTSATELGEMADGTLFQLVDGHTYVKHKHTGGAFIVAKPVDEDGKVLDKDPAPSKYQGQARRIFHERMAPSATGAMSPDYTEQWEAVPATEAPPVIDPALSPARSAKGNLRNYKAMGDTKLKGLADEMASVNDPEAVQAINAELSKRDLPLIQGDVSAPEAPSAPKATPTPSPSADAPQAGEGELYDLLKKSVENAQAAKGDDADPLFAFDVDGDQDAVLAGLGSNNDLTPGEIETLSGSPAPDVEWSKVIRAIAGSDASDDEKMSALDVIVKLSPDDELADEAQGAQQALKPSSKPKGSSLANEGSLSAPDLDASIKADVSDAKEASDVANSPARSSKGNLRNFKAMSDTKLASLAEDMEVFTGDHEAVDAINAELDKRGMDPIDPGLGNVPDMQAPTPEQEAAANQPETPAQALAMANPGHTEDLDGGVSIVKTSSAYMVTGPGDAPPTLAQTAADALAKAEELGQVTEPESLTAAAAQLNADPGVVKAALTQLADMGIDLDPAIESADTLTAVIKAANIDLEALSAASAEMTPG